MAEPNQPRREPNNKRPGGNKRDYGKLRPVHAVSWSDVTQESLVAAVTRVTALGAAIMFGRTSDGGAFSITVLDGDERIREWPHTPEECDKTLDWLCEMFAGD